MRENIMNLRNGMLKHNARADRFHTVWSLLEDLSNLLTISFLLLTAILMVSVLFTGNTLLTIPAWISICIAWLLIQSLIEVTIESIRTRQRMHELEANQCATQLENMGLDPTIFQ